MSCCIEKGSTWIPILAIARDRSMSMESAEEAKCTIYVASPITSKEYISSMREKLSSVLEDYGYGHEVLVTSMSQIGLEATMCSSMVIIVLSGGTERLILEISRRAPRTAILLVALPYANSLPALLEVKPLLRARRATAYLPCIDCNEGERRLREALGALEASARLIGARLGVIGGPSSWLVYSWVDPTLVHDRLGVAPVHIPLDVVYEEFSKIEPDNSTARELASRIISSASIVNVAGSEVLNAVRLYLAFRRIVDKYNLQVITVKCFDIIEELGVTPCVALSLLNSEGVVAGCEGDILSAIAMAMASWVSGEPAFMGNPSIIDGDKVLISHCSAPVVMARRGYSLVTHFETGRAVSIAAEFEENVEVTLLRLSDTLKRMRIIVGRTVRGKTRVEMQCRSQMWVRLPVDPEELLLEQSMGNHYVVVYGDRSYGLKLLARLVSISYAIYK